MQKYATPSFSLSSIMNILIKLYFLATLVANAPGVYAWGAAGHEIVATIAEMHLYPTVLPTICSILYPPSSPTSSEGSAEDCNLASIATWADKVRYHMRWSAPLHYVGGKGDHPPQTCVYPGDGGWAGREDINVLGGIRNVTGVLVDWVEGGREVGDPRANEALKFLVHFLGDLHMPLHLTGRDRGGNGDKVLWDGRVTNLHSLWDSLIVAKAIRNTPLKYNRPLPDPSIERHLRGAIYDSFIRKIVWEGISVKWADEVESWIDCPVIEEPEPVQLSFWEQTKQLFLGNSAKPEDTDDEVVCPYHWSKPIHQLNCDFIWPKEMDEPPYSHISGRQPSGGPYLELDTAEYGGRIADEWMLEKLMATAGVRLASILNWLFVETGAA